MPVEQNDEEDNFEEIQSEIDDKETDLAPYKLITYGADYTLQVLAEKLEAEDIIVPPFQRKYIWPLVKASKLIESFLLGLPVPQIFLYKEVDTETLTVVDGQQRLVEKILQDLDLVDHPSIFLIDARLDNKPSASRA